MNEGYDIAILPEIDRIVAKYGLGQVTRLAELIRDPRRAEELASLLESAAARVPKSKAKSRSRRSDRVGMAVVNDLRMSDPEKHSVIAEIRRELVSRTALVSMTELRRFADMHDLSIGKASSRTAAIAPLLKSLSQLSTPEIVSLRDSIIHSKVNDRSLDNWREVIVRPMPSKKPVSNP